MKGGPSAYGTFGGRCVVPDALRLSIVSGRLALAIMRSGLSRAEVSRRSGVSEAAISRYVRGERMVSTHALISLCSVLNVPSDWILGLDPATRERFRESVGAPLGSG